MKHLLSKFLGRERNNDSDLKDGFDIYLTEFHKQKYQSLIIMTKKIETMKDIEFIKYFLEYSPLKNTILMVFESSKMIDFDLVLNEKPQNLLSGYFEHYHADKTSVTGRLETGVFQKRDKVSISIGDVMIRINNAGAIHEGNCLYREQC